MKRIIGIKGLCIVLALLWGACGATAEPVRIFAAASLQGPLDEVAATWPGEVSISYAGSGTIARQVSLGAPVDVVMLAHPQWMTWLKTNGLLAAPPRNIVSNRLALIGPAGTPSLEAPDTEMLLALLGDGRLAMGQHQAVPAGIYAQAWLDTIGAWPDIRTRLAETENVRAALTLVARGETPLGIVYQSDAQLSDAVDVLYTITADMHPPIRYPAGAVTQKGLPFLDHLTDNTALFVAAGFVALR